MENLTTKKYLNVAILTWLFLFLAFSLYLGFGLTHLGKFQSADEDLWISNPATGRVHQYWAALLSRNWQRTHVNDKPGVTTALVSGSIGLLVDTHPRDKVAKVEGTDATHVFNAPLNEHTSFFFRLPILIVNGLLILLLFWLLFIYSENELFALFAGVFIFLSPILIGISQIVNPDATAWSFSITALVAYWIFLKKERFGFLITAGILAGFALLSKYSATYVLLFALFSTFAHMFFLPEHFPDKETLSRYLLKTLLGFIVFLAIAITVFSLFMPAVFWHPEYIYQATVGFKLAAHVKPILILVVTLFATVLFDAVFLKSRILFWLLRKLQIFRYPILIIFTALLGVLLFFSFANWSLHDIFGLPNIPFDLGRFKHFYQINEVQKALLEVKVLPFTITPIVLFFSLYALFRPVWTRNGEFLTFLLGSFVAFFYAAVTLQGVVLSVRYGIFLYPAMALLAALGLSKAVPPLFAKLPMKFRENNFLLPAAILCVIFISGASVVLAKPFYFNYTNAFLPKSTIVTGAWGYGGYEAAAALNTLPDAKDLVAWSDYDGFCPFFVGKCLRGTTIKWYNGGDFQNIDYFVMSRRGYILNQAIWDKMLKNGIFEEEPVWTLFIDGRPQNFVKIYRSVHPSSEAVKKEDSD